MAMTVRLTEKEDAQLTQLAEILGVSKQQAIIAAIDEAFRARDHQIRFEAAKEHTLTRYADLLRRLGDA